MRTGVKDVLTRAGHYLWRALDQDGHALDILVQRYRDTRAAKRFFHKLFKGLTDVPRVLITDQLKSYGAAKRELLPSVEHRQHRSLNNRAEHSHQPTRQRERRMQGFKSSGQAQPSGSLPRMGRLPSTSGPDVTFYLHLSTTKKCSNDFTPGRNSQAYRPQPKGHASGNHAPIGRDIMLTANKLIKP